MWYERQVDLSQLAVLLASFWGAVFALLLGLLVVPFAVYAAGQVLHQVPSGVGASRPVLHKFDFAAWRRAQARYWHRSKSGALRHMWGSAGGYMARFVIVAMAGWMCGMMANLPYFLGRELGGRPVAEMSVVLPVVGALLAVRSLVRSIRYARGTDDRMRADPVYTAMNCLDMTHRFTTLRLFYLHRSLRAAAAMAVPLAGLLFVAALQGGVNRRPADSGTTLVSQVDLNGYALFASLLLAMLLSSLVGKGVDRLLIAGSLADCLRQCLRPPDERQRQDLMRFFASRRRALIKVTKFLAMMARRVDRDLYGDPLASVIYGTSTYIKQFLGTRSSRDPELPGEVVNILRKVVVVAAHPSSSRALDDLRSAIADNPFDATQLASMREPKVSFAERLKTWFTSFIMLADAWKIILIIIAIIYVLLGRHDLSELPIPH